MTQTEHTERGGPRAPTPQRRRGRRRGGGQRRGRRGEHVRVADALGQAKVDEQVLAGHAVVEKVARLDVAVHDPVRVHVRQRHKQPTHVLLHLRQRHVVHIVLQGLIFFFKKKHTKKQKKTPRSNRAPKP